MARWTVRVAVLLACSSTLHAGGGIYKKLHVTPVPRTGCSWSRPGKREPVDGSVALHPQATWGSTLVALLVRITSPMPDVR